MAVRAVQTVGSSALGQSRALESEAPAQGRPAFTRQPVPVACNQSPHSTSPSLTEAVCFYLDVSCHFTSAAVDLMRLEKPPSSECTSTSHPSLLCPSIKPSEPVPYCLGFG